MIRNEAKKNELQTKKKKTVNTNGSIREQKIHTLSLKSDIKNFIAK